MGEHKKVLVIDDDAHVRRVIQVKLRNQGYEVMLARDGEEGLSLIKTVKPDAVITDINMPKLDGETLCRQTNEIKKERRFFQGWHREKQRLSSMLGSYPKVGIFLKHPAVLLPPSR